MSLDLPLPISSDARTSKLITSTSPSEARFKLDTAAAMLSKPEPAIEWLIENIWVDKSRGLLAGNPGVGKTWLALDMLISVASGQPFLGQYPVKQGAVLLVEEESSELNLSRRLHSLARARGLKDSDLTNLYLLTRQFTKIPKDLKELFHVMAGLDIKLVVFDSLRRFHHCDENSSSEMQEVLDGFAKLNVMTEASIVLIHHLAKNTDFNKPLFERLRGSSDLWAWRDCLIGVEGEEDADQCLCSFQFRDAESPLPIAVKRSVNEQTGAITMLAIEPDFVEKIEIVTTYLKSQYGGCSKNKIIAGTKGKRQELLRVLAYMQKKQIIIENGSGFVLNDTPY